MTVQTPENIERIDRPDGMPEGVEATVSSNTRMAERLSQPAAPTEMQNAETYGRFFKANGRAVEHTDFHTGRGGNTIAFTEGATQRRLAEDTLEAAEIDAAEMAEAEQIMDQVAEVRSNAAEDAKGIDTAGIPPGNPERDEVANLSADYAGAEAGAEAELTSIETETVANLNAAVSGVDEDEPNLAQAG